MCALLDADGVSAPPGPTPGGAQAVLSGRRGDGDLPVTAWQQLHRQFARLPTQSLEFAQALSHTLLGEALIEVFTASCDGNVVALLPLCRSLGLFARWRMLGAREVFEPGDALCTDAEGATRLAEVLAGQGRPLTLDRVPANSPLLEPLQAACKGKAWVTVRPAVACPTIALDERWREPESCFNSGRRSDFRRAARRAAEFGQVSFEILSPAPEQFDALFDEAVAVEQSSWKKEAGTAMAMDRGKEAFFRAYFRACCQNGHFRVAFMRIDGKAVAMQLAVESCERFWLFKIGFDEAYAKGSPGTLLMLHTLRHAAGNDLRAYELLGNIEPWIAEFWTREQHDCVRLRTYPFNFRGAFAFAADAANWLRSRVTRSGR